MPEGPEILRAAERVARAVAGRVAATVRFGLPRLARLGVELLAPDTTLARGRAQLDLARFQRRTLAALLLDQGFLAGLGNYLRSEVLYVARLAPDMKLGTLTAAQKDALGRASLELTRQSYRTRGITNELERAARLKRAGLAFGRYRHHVFDREGEPCWACGMPIVRSLGAGRNVFACARCQPLGASASPAAPRRRSRRGAVP